MLSLIFVFHINVMEETSYNPCPDLVSLCPELEVKPNVVTVAAVTREDREALKLINMLQMVPALETGMMVHYLYLLNPYFTR